MPEPTDAPGLTRLPRATLTAEPTAVPRLGSWINPISLGEYGEVRDFRTPWQLGVGEIYPDARAIIQKESEFDKPLPGRG